MKVEATLKASAKVKAGLPKAVSIGFAGVDMYLTAVGHYVVEVWLQSATGDSSDSIITSIPCDSEQQAKDIAEAWKEIMRNI